MKKNNFFIIFFGVLILVGTIFSVTYAWFTADVLNPIGSSITTAAAQIGDIIFTDGNEINISGSLPGDTYEKHFTVVRNGEYDEEVAPAINYKINLNIIENTLTDVSDGYFLYTLIGTTSNDGLPVSKENQVVPSETSALGIGTLNGNDVHTYTMSIGLVENGSDQRSTMGKRFNASLEIEAVDLIEDVTIMEEGYTLVSNNLLQNPAFTKYSESVSPWNTLLNPEVTKSPDNWSNGYNGGVASPSEGYHAYFENDTFGYMVFTLHNLNGSYGYSKRWLGTCQLLNPDLIKPNTKYLVAMDIYSDTVRTINNGGFYAGRSANINITKSPYTFTSTSSEINKWVRKRAIIETKDFEYNEYIRFYIYGYCGVEGTTYVKNVFLGEIE